jgi:hypothetical protein
MWCYTFPVPTTKQRITVTATGDLERILEVQAALHPELSPSALVVLLVERGHAAGLQDDRRQLVERLAGGVHYPRGEREALLEEWPD